MTHRLYDDLAAWFPLVSPASQYDEEAAVYAACLSQAADGPIRTLLELGSGAGTVASHLPPPWALTLVDRSPAMLAVSQTRRPDAEHLQGDMTTLRLQRQFDAVLLHDAVMYLTTPEALSATFDTLAAHVRPGGAVAIIPDVTTETFFESTMMDGGDEGDRSVRLTEWRWDPDPSDHTFLTELILAIREDGAVRTVHETHEMGLYSSARFLDEMRRVGLEPVVPDLPPGVACGQVFLGRMGVGR